MLMACCRRGSQVPIGRGTTAAAGRKTGAVHHGFPVGQSPVFAGIRCLAPGASMSAAQAARQTVQRHLENLWYPSSMASLLALLFSSEAYLSHPRLTCP